MKDGSKYDPTSPMRCSVFACGGKSSVMLDGRPYCPGHDPVAREKREEAAAHVTNSKMADGRSRCSHPECMLRGDFTFAKQKWCDRHATEAYNISVAVAHEAKKAKTGAAVHTPKEERPDLMSLTRANDKRQEEKRAKRKAELEVSRQKLRDDALLNARRKEERTRLKVEARSKLLREAKESLVSVPYQARLSALFEDPPLPTDMTELFRQRADLLHKGTVLPTAQGIMHMRAEAFVIGAAILDALAKGRQ